MSALGPLPGLSPVPGTPSQRLTWLTPPFRVFVQSHPFSKSFLDLSLKTANHDTSPHPISCLVLVPSAYHILFIDLYLVLIDCRSWKAGSLSAVFPVPRAASYRVAAKYIPESEPGDIQVKADTRPRAPTAPGTGACSRAPPIAQAGPWSQTSGVHTENFVLKRVGIPGHPLPPPRSLWRSQARVQTGQHKWIPGAERAARRAQRGCRQWSTTSFSPAQGEPQISYLSGPCFSTHTHLHTHACILILKVPESQNLRILKTYLFQFSPVLFLKVWTMTSCVFPDPQTLQESEKKKPQEIILWQTQLVATSAILLCFL